MSCCSAVESCFWHEQISAKGISADRAKVLSYDRSIRSSLKVDEEIRRGFRPQTKVNAFVALAKLSIELRLLRRHHAENAGHLQKLPASPDKSQLSPLTELRSLKLGAVETFRSSRLASSPPIIRMNIPSASRPVCVATGAAPRSLS